MKLLLITAIKEFEDQIKQMLKKAAVQSFSCQDVKGFKNNSGAADATNWFGSEGSEIDSILFYAFVAKEKVDLLFELVATFNNEQESLSQIHVAVLNIEKSN